MKHDCMIKCIKGLNHLPRNWSAFLKFWMLFFPTIMFHHCYCIRLFPKEIKALNISNILLFLEFSLQVINNVRLYKQVSATEALPGEY